MVPAQTFAAKTLTAQQGAGVLKGSIASSVAAKSAPAGGVFFAGKSLGLGIGMGIWGPLLIGAAGAAAIYGYIRSRNAEDAQTFEEAAVDAALADAVKAKS